MEPERRWRAIAARQHQLVTHAQLVEAGLTRAMIRHRVSAGVLAVVHQGVYRLEGVHRTWRQRTLALVLASGASAVASHRAAARLGGLDGRWDTIEPEALVVRPATGATALGLVHRTLRLPSVDQRLVDRIPATTPARTLIDLGAVVDRSEVEAALDSALRDGVVREAFLRWRLAEVGGHGVPGAGVLNDLLGPDRTTRPRGDSWLEARALELFAIAGLPAPACQRLVQPDTGRVLRVDFTFQAGAVVVEVNGHATHSTRRQRQIDHERANRMALAGITVLQFTYEDVVERPEHVVAMVRAAVAASAAA